MTPLAAAALLVTAALLVMALTMGANLLFFPRLRLRSPAGRAPAVSVLIPARNEARRIGQTVRAVLNQAYADFELLVLNDNSTDGTGAAVCHAAAGDGRLRLLDGRPLPEGWLGKNWACHQLAQEARGDYLLFIDADVLLAPGTLAALLAEAQAHRSDLLTIWPTQHTATWGERLTVPLISLVVLAYLPVILVHETPWPLFAAANGQCMLFRRHAYGRVGGHRAVRGRIVEDVALSRRTKAERLRLRMADGAGLVSCRMYQSWPEARDGFAKNILAGHGQSILFLLASTLFHWLVFIGPWLWLLAGGGLWALLLGLAGVGLRAVSALYSGQRARDALLMPVSVLLMTLIAMRSIWWRLRGRTAWKGRVAAV